jgi:hypothetical protein
MKSVIRLIGLVLVAVAMYGCGDSSPFNLFGPTPAAEPGARAKVIQVCEQDKSAAVNVNASQNCDKSNRTAEPTVVQVPTS